MPFSISGSTITQTGTDTDLSGLSGISGVTTETTGSGEKQVTTYKISGRRLQINGDLSHDPDKEIIIYDTNSLDITHRIGNGGTYRYGGKTTVNGVDRFSKGVGLIFTRTTTGSDAFFSESKSNIFIEAGGTFIGRGGVIFTSAIQQFGGASNVTVDLENTQFFLRHTGTGSDAERDIRFDVLASSSTFKNVVFDAIEGVIQYIGINANALPPTFEVVLKNATIGQFVNTNIDFTLQNLDTSENIADADIAFDSGSNGSDGFEIINSAIGSGVNALPRASTASSRALGFCRVFRRTQFTVQDLSGTTIEGAKVYAVDNDNGNRKSGNGINETADRVYDLTTDVNGETPETDILLAVTNRLVNGTQGTFDTGDNRIDRRTKNDQQGVKNQPDELDFNFASYNHLLNIGTFDFRGLNNLEITRVLFEDTVITETTKATVDAYTELETPQKFYDRAKAYLVDNYAGETTTIVTRSGTEIDVGSNNVVIDATASSAFAFNGSTITIKATTFTGNIRTTGTVTLANGATVTGSIFDSTADSSLTFAGIDSWRLFLNEADRDTNTNPTATGLVTESFGFIFSGQTFYLRLIVGGDIILKDVTPASSGETEVSLSTAGILTAQGSVLSNIDTQLGFIGRVVYVDTQLTTNGNGSAGSPFNSIDDAISLYNSGSYSFIELKTSLLAPAVPSVSLAGVKIRGGNPTASLFINNLSIQNGEIDDVLLSGVQALGDNITVYRGVTFSGNYSNLAGNVVNSQVLSLLGQDVTISFQSSTSIISMDVTNVGQVNFDIGDISVAFRRITGRFNFINMIAGSTCSIDSISGQLVVAASCTGGNLRISDTLEVNDNSQGTTITIEDLPTLDQIEASTVLAKQSGLAILPTLPDIEQSAVLAKEATISSIKTKTDAIQVSNGNVHSDAKRLNGAIVVGDGSEADKWRGQGA